MLFHDPVGLTGLESRCAGVVEGPEGSFLEGVVGRREPFFLHNRKLTGGEDRTTEEQAEHAEGVVIAETRGAHTVGVFLNFEEVIPAPVDRGDDKLLEVLQDIGRVPAHDGDLSGKGQVVADEDLGSDGDPHAHGLVVAVAKADGEAERVVGALAIGEDTKHLISLSGQAILGVDQRTIREQGLGCLLEIYGQVPVIDRLIGVGLLRNWDVAKVVEGDIFATGVHQ